jgi:hypothetical protein
MQIFTQIIFNQLVDTFAISPFQIEIKPIKE